MAASLDKVRAWLKTRHYTLRPGTEYACFWQDRVVTYRAHDTRQTQLEGLLHECGHVLVGRTPGSSTRYKRGYPSPRKGKARTNESAADLVHEEIEAWHRGWALGQRLRVRVNAAAYWATYGRCIKRYFRRAVDRAI